MPTCGVGLLRDDLERRIVRLAIPALGTLAVEPLYVLVDTAIVGRLGTPQLAGLAIASTVLLTVVSLTAALEYGLTPDVAFAHGRGDEPEARRVATNGLQLAALLGVPMGLALGLAAIRCAGCSAAAATSSSTPPPTCASAWSGCPSCWSPTSATG